jgi:hypothetical protein
VTITQSGSLNLTATPGTITCNGGTTSVTLAATGGTSPYTYGGTTTNLTAGTYNFTVTDAAGCSAATTITITQPPPITTTQAVTNVTCNGASNGSVVITPAGGTPGYTITPAQTGLAAGTYTFTVTDSKGCTATTSVTITQPPLITTTQAVTNVTCNGARQWLSYNNTKRWNTRLYHHSCTNRSCCRYVYIYSN